MPSFCCVVNCGKRGEKNKVSFFRFPAVLRNRGENTKALSEERRNNYCVKALKRGPLSEQQLKTWRICSRHFIGGSPSAELKNRLYPAGYQIRIWDMSPAPKQVEQEQAVSRHDRIVKRKKLIHDADVNV